MLATQHGLTDCLAPKILHQDVCDTRAWRREQVSPIDWLVPFPEAGIAELDAIADVVDRDRQPVLPLDLERFPHLTACHRLMAQACATLDQIGMAIIDRLPVERYRHEQNKAIYSILGQLLGRLVEQKWDDVTLYDVKDSGKALGHGVRRSITNLSQPFHTDGPWLSITPPIIGLFCLQSAQSGGMSRLVSLLTAHNAMRRRHPDLLKRLYQPFFWDRQAEHGPSDTPYSAYPVFAYDGEQLSARYYDDYIRKGYALAGETLDARGQEALDAMRTIVEETAHWVEFRLESGQMQFLNNRQFAHARTAFVDDGAARSGRHLIRSWHRNEGAPTLEGRIDSLGLTP